MRELEYELPHGTVGMDRPPSEEGLGISHISLTKDTEEMLERRIIFLEKSIRKLLELEESVTILYGHIRRLQGQHEELECQDCERGTLTRLYVTEHVTKLEKRVRLCEEFDGRLYKQVAHLEKWMKEIHDAYVEMAHPEGRVAELEAPDGATWKQIHTLMEQVARLEECAYVYDQADNEYIPMTRGPHD